jgi:hypothetical protein
MLGRVDVLVTDVMTGRTTGLSRTVRRALASLAKAEVPHCVIGAVALAARGLPRMTRDLDVAVMFDDAADAIDALRSAGLRVSSSTATMGDPEPTIALVDPRTKIRAIVQSRRANLKHAERILAVIHEEMLGAWRARVKQARSPAPAPARPSPRPRRKAAAALAPVSPRHRPPRRARRTRTSPGRTRG